MDILNYWKAVLNQDAEKMKPYFHQDAFINWHNTNEHFSVDEFIRANCEYPGQWDGTVERIEKINDLLISVTHVFTRDRSQSFHVTSFIRLKNEQIMSIDEYWGDDGSAPQWRLDLHLGTPIKP